MDVITPCETPLLEQLFNEYRAEKLGNRSPDTLARYMTVLRKLNQFLDRQAEPADVSGATIHRFLQHNLDGGCKAGTINKSITLLENFSGWLCQNDITTEAVHIPRLNEPQGKPQPWRADDIRRLVDAAVCDEYMTNGIRRGPFWQALILTLRDTEATLAAVLAARWCDIDAPYLLVGADGRKHNERCLRRKLSRGTLAAIEAIRRPERALILDWPHTRRTRVAHASHTPKPV